MASLPSAETPMASSTSLRASTLMAVNSSLGSPPPGPPTPLTKYAKIQPAIAIKPKPLALAPSPKSAFNPRYDPAALSSSLLAEDVLGNINTLRRWVLPPRPRPGRRPTGVGGLSPPPPTKTTKKLKVQKRDDTKLARAASSPAPSLVLGASSGPIGVGLSTPRRLGLSASGQLLLKPFGNRPGYSGQTSTPSATPTAKLAATTAAPRDPEARPLQTAPPQVSELQTMYLARLKEQQLIRNYIEVLTNQIKELRFVQSGVITVDALNGDAGDKPKLAPLPRSELLDHINNVNDLDKFLAHLTTQSNVIHSVTKRFVGTAHNHESHLQLQIRYYLELRANSASSGLPRALESPQQVPESAPTLVAASFTPSLLRPLKMNLFDSEDDVIDVDILNEGDSLLPTADTLIPNPDVLLATGGLGERLKFDALLVAADTDFVTLSTSPEQKPAPALAPAKKAKKAGCGFCTADTPCVCFDADSIFGEPK